MNQLSLIHDAKEIYRVKHHDKYEDVQLEITEAEDQSPRKDLNKLANHEVISCW